MSQTDKLLAEISEKLDKMLRLLAIDAVKGITKEQEKIEYFKSLSLQVQKNLIGKLYSQKTLDLVLSTLQEYRNQKADTQ